MSTISLQINVEETDYEEPTEWRMLGAKGKAEHVIRLCERNNVSPERILEVGAGDGAILRCLAEIGFCRQMHALEISQSGVDVILKQNIPGLMSCQTFDGYTLPFQDKFFDLVILSHVLEHIEYERALLRELLRVSKNQIIEIPMDCNALQDEVYHLLGPSYGHINAYTPESLRFLLSTENFLVVDDLLGQYSLELQEYDWFVNNNHEHTPEACEQFRKGYKEREAQFGALPRSAQVAQSSYYVVLTRELDAEARLMRAMSAVKKSIDNGQVQAARLIFDHYVPEALVPHSALEIASSAINTSSKVALEFVNRVLAIDKTNSNALALKERISRSMSDNHSLMDPLPQPLGRATLVQRAKAFIKYRCPRLACILRKLRR